ncbi:MAG TPA: CDP-alcohol phosphatidyltransferase family protein [Sporichthya sp.]|nr:CDP-alcohol phosphatidyltransferase family protein [Sporichthya sp.]
MAPGWEIRETGTTGASPGTREAYLAAWADSHGGHDPAGGGRAERAWFALVFRAAAPLRRVSPDALTAAAVVVAALAATVAGGAARWCLLAAVLVALSAVLDGVDGAVAVMTGRATRWGHLIDSLGDRVAEALFGFALYEAGAPWQLCAAAVASGWLHEYARARAGAGGVSEILVVTVAERPTRVIAAVLGLLVAGLLGPDSVGELDAELAAFCGAVAWCSLGLVGLGQLMHALRRALR